MYNSRVTSQNEAVQRDETDELAGFREFFYRQPGQIYLDGNSLGLLCVQAEQSLLRALEQWKTRGVDGWTDAESPWFTLAETLAARVAPLVGASPDEVIVANSTTVNLHQLLATLFDPQSARTLLLADSLAFPSDIYALQSLLRRHGRDPETDLARVQSRDGLTLREDDIVAAMSERVQIAVLPSVVYTSGQLLDMAWLTKKAREKNVLIGWDCSHSIGAMTHELSAWGADFAFWCHYKYLNAGPGAVGGLYLNRRHFGRVPGLAGWFSADKARQFDMAHELTAADGAGALQIGTPSILSLAPLSGALDVIAEAGMERTRRKSLALTQFLMDLVDAELSAFGFVVANPREDARRGGHVALVHPEASRICRALKEANVIADFRPPQIIRLAPVALYTSFTDCWDAIGRLKVIMTERVYERFAEQRALVP